MSGIVFDHESSVDIGDRSAAPDLVVDSVVSDQSENNMRIIRSIIDIDRDGNPDLVTWDKRPLDQNIFSFMLGIGHSKTVLVINPVFRQKAFEPVIQLFGDLDPSVDDGHIEREIFHDGMQIAAEEIENFRAALSAGEVGLSNYQKESRTTRVEDGVMLSYGNPACGVIYRGATVFADPFDREALFDFVPIRADWLENLGYLANCGPLTTVNIWDQSILNELSPSLWGAMASR